MDSNHHSRFQRAVCYRLHHQAINWKAPNHLSVTALCFRFNGRPIENGGRWENRTPLPLRVAQFSRLSGTIASYLPLSNFGKPIARFLYRFRLRSAATIIHLSYQPGENYLSYHALFGIATSGESCASSAPLTRTLARPAASTALLLLQTGTSSAVGNKPAGRDCPVFQNLQQIWRLYSDSNRNSWFRRPVPYTFGR